MSFLYKIIKYRKVNGVLSPIREKRKRTSWLVLILLTAICALVTQFWLNLPENPTHIPLEVYRPHREQPHQHDPYKDLTLVEAHRATYTTSAYNPVPEQTSGDPCIAASGQNVCFPWNSKDDMGYAAANFLPFWTMIEIEGRVYIIVDRVSEEYGDRIDIVFPADQIQEAKEWGLRYLEVIIYE